MDLDDLSTSEPSSQIPEESPSPVDDTQEIGI
jgi:hypothetical protein